MHLSTYSILHSKNRHPNKTFFYTKTVLQISTKKLLGIRKLVLTKILKNKPSKTKIILLLEKLS